MTEKSTAIIVHQKKFSAGDMDTGNCIIRQIYSDLICCNRTQTTKIFSAPYNHTVLDYYHFLVHVVQLYIRTAPPFVPVHTAQCMLKFHSSTRGCH